jgi:predicted glycosyltransferase
MWYAISKHGFTGPISMEGTITNQQYLQQLQNEVILVIQGGGHVGTTFIQQDGA